MLINRYFDELFQSFAHMGRAHYNSVPRIPSRLVRYGIIYGDSAKNALADFEPKFDPMMKRQAELMVEKLQAFIDVCEAYESETVDGPTEADDAKAKGKAKRKA